MSATNFWPRATKYDVHVLPLDFPGTLSNTARALINETLLLMRSYCPHHDVENCTNIMANLGVITDTIEYEQRIREV